MTAADPQIDFTRIEFPSDKLTIKMFRQAWPNAIDVDLEERLAFGASESRKYRRNSLDETLGVGILDLEREIAERAFKVAVGQPLTDEPRRLADRDEMIECITNEYIRLGLAHGEHDSMAMIRRIETQAEAQARQHGGRTP